ncbi:hypothetical protein ES705_32352 [subsurface metagenome]
MSAELFELIMQIDNIPSLVVVAVVVGLQFFLLLRKK